MDVQTLRCGRLRRDGSRCHRRLAVLDAETEFGAVRMRARGTTPQSHGRTVPDEIVAVLGAALGLADRWTLDCNSRCGAHFVITDAHLAELARTGRRDVYLAEELNRAR